MDNSLPFLLLSYSSLLGRDKLLGNGGIEHRLLAPKSTRLRGERV